MCEPVSLAVATSALGIGQSVLGFDAQNQQAKSTERNYWQNWTNAQKGYQTDLMQVGERQMQEQTSTALRKLQTQREYDAAKGTANVASQESGVTGLSMDAILGDLAGQQGRRLDAETLQAGYTGKQLQDQKAGLQTATENRINAAQRGQKANPWALALQIGGTVLQGASTYNKMGTAGQTRST